MTAAGAEKVAEGGRQGQLEQALKFAAKMLRKQS